MDGLHELTAAEATLTIAGRDYRMSPLRLRDWGEIERRILDTRPDPLDLVLSKLDGLPLEQQRELLSLAYDDARQGRRLTANELRQWLATPEGQVVQFWLSLRQHQPALTLEDAERLLLLAGSETLAEQQATNLAELDALSVGNACGQTHPAPSPPPSPGATSFAN